MGDAHNGVHIRAVGVVEGVAVDNGGAEGGNGFGGVDGFGEDVAGEVRAEGEGEDRAAVDGGVDDGLGGFEGERGVRGMPGTESDRRDRGSGKTLGGCCKTEGGGVAVRVAVRMAVRVRVALAVGVIVGVLVVMVRMASGPGDVVLLFEGS